ncbi:50S ribosomal protein L29 [Candidatus Bandiella euplotis]|uniref:Large ribosomal subunit protein uL29 n=1 Tax=Candidatus Bandiella euplotis TaxID=1664265 RepID=A0ABZ0UKW6_9RICK|nr:50S ribosomal protein L29 [Candidatus Bandiella woodruffii]WPX96774.1 50S ribosomal protein L29 [Candidatus Bandiella woodruffii]
MKFKELEKLDKKTLQDELIKYKKESLNLRFQKVLGELTNTSRVKEVRKTIARIFTALNKQKQI